MREGHVVQEYFRLLSEYQEKYGEKTTILFQKGAFYELYGIDNDQVKVNHIKDIFENILHQSVTYCSGWNDEKNTYSNPQMAGFPTYTLEKNLPPICKAGYTVVEIVETGEKILMEGKAGKYKIKKRILKKVHSPSTLLLDFNSDENTNLVCLYIDNSLSKDLSKLIIGVSSINLITGVSLVYHFYEILPNELIASVIQVISSIDPAELIISCSHPSKEVDIYDKIIKMFNLEFYKIHAIHEPAVAKASYQNEFLSGIFTNTKKESPLVFVKLNKYQEVATSYVYMLKFAIEHDEDILKNLGKPTIYNKTKYLTYSDRTSYHLNLFSTYHLQVDNKSKKLSPLVKIIDKTTTLMGKRLLKQKIINPIYNNKKLRESYKIVAKIIETEISKSIETDLKDISDIERLRRAMAINIITPRDFISLHKSCLKVQDILCKVKKLDSMSNLISFDRERLKGFIEEYSAVLDIDGLMNAPLTKKFSCTETMFLKGVNKTIDKYVEKISEYTNFIDTDIEEIRRMLGVKIKTSFHDTGLVIQLSKAKSKIFSQLAPKSKQLSNHEFTYDKKRKSGDDISSDLLIKWSLTKKDYEKRLEVSVNRIYNEYISAWYRKYSVTLNGIIKFISELDVHLSFALVAMEYKYVKPIIRKLSGESYIKGNKVRNPIVERNINDVEYTPIDIELGTPDNNGLLLYGINSSGKSTVLRMIGLSIILAQIGSFVPADKFIYYPYTKLITKMTNEDNQYMGESTFIREIMDLKEMTESSNKNTLILGDEIASGTETRSAISILASALVMLSKDKISLAFATHYHELMSIQEVTELSNLQIKYIEIKIVNGEIIYNRELKSGSGPSDYGIKIATTMNMRKEFIQQAKKYKTELYGDDDSTIPSTKTSRYNSELYMSKCAICGKRKNLDTHHIKFQSTADDMNMIHSQHKNVKSNLVVLCKMCHNKEHKGKIKITGYIETENGVKLVVDG